MVYAFKHFYGSLICDGKGDNLVNSRRLRWSVQLIEFFYWFNMKNFGMNKFGSTIQKLP